MSDIEIDEIENGFVVRTDNGLSRATEYSPTIGLALSRVLYRLLRQTADMPSPHNETEGGKVWESDTFKSIKTFLHTFGFKAVEEALADNLKEAQAWEKAHPEPVEETGTSKEVPTVEKATEQDI